MSPSTVILGALVALAALAPLPFGSVPEWAGGMLAGSVGALLAGWGALALRGSVPLVRPPAWFWLAAGLFLAALGWAVAQTLASFPAAPSAFRWEGAAAIGPVALDPAAGRAAAVGIAACGGVFWLALQTGRDAKRAAWLFAALGFAAALQALYGLLAHLSGTNTILWFEKTAYRDVVTGTFVNRNTFATHMALGLLCLAAALREAFRASPAHSVPRREWLRRLVAQATLRKAMLLFAALVVGYAILLSESRAGSASALLALTAFLAILALRRGRALPAVAVATGALGAGLLAATVGEGLERRLWTAQADWEGRRQIAAETLDAIRAAPLRGVGLGGFEAAHRMHREAGGAVRIERAHNDYLQTALELGVPGALALFASLGTLAFACARAALRRRRNAAYPAAGFAACVLVGAHAALDFSLRVPAVSVLFSLMLGVAVAQAWRQKRGGGGVKKRIAADHRKSPTGSARHRSPSLPG